MGSPRFFSPLALIALVWRFVMRLDAWPSERVRRPTPAAPLGPRRPPAPESKPFAGLTPKPSCVLWAEEASGLNTSPPVRPDPRPSTHRRPRTVDTAAHVCPHTGCDYRGWLGLGNLRTHGHSRGGPGRQGPCRACDGYFLETQGTLFPGQRVAVALLVRVLACLAEGRGMRATARGCAVAPNTVLRWRVEAAQQLEALSQYFLCEGPVQQGQLDEV